ncbi:guanine nucleotide binding protein, alpha subunit, partial [Cladorrhinum sp. PSN332]
YRVWDVGGVRLQQNSWRNELPLDLNILLFQVPLSVYDVMIKEDGETVRAHSNLFKSLWHLQRHDTIKFLNFTKMDIFERKIKSVRRALRHDQSLYNREPDDVKAGIEYYVDRFREVGFRTKVDNTFAAFLDATDTAQASLLLNKILEVSQAR